MVDAVSAQVFDLIPSTGSAAQGAASPPQIIDVANFEAALGAVEKPPQVEPVPESQSSGFKSAVGVLDSLNGGIESIGADAQSILANTEQMTPGDMITLTMKAHHFLFQSELTANIANRTSEGVQQLFRQQS